MLTFAPQNTSTSSKALVAIGVGSARSPSTLTTRCRRFSRRRTGARFRATLTPRRKRPVSRSSHLGKPRPTRTIFATATPPSLLELRFVSSRLVDLSCCRTLLPLCPFLEPLACSNPLRQHCSLPAPS
jgi:hypothetical protein